MVYTPASYTPGASRSLSTDQIAHLQEAALAITMTASLEPRDVLDRVVAAARALLETDAAVLFGLNHGRFDFPLLAASGRSSEERRISVAAADAPPVEAAVGKAIKEKHIVGIEDLGGVASRTRRRSGDFAVREGFNAVLAAPLIAGASQPLGAIALYSRSRRAWNNDDATMLSLFAAHAGVAIQNARLFERLNRRAADLQALCEVSHLLGSFIERAPLLDTVIGRLVGWLGARQGAIMLVERGENGEAELKIRSHHGLSEEYVAWANEPGGISLDPRHPTGRGPASVAARECRPCAIGDVFVDETFAPFRGRARTAGYLAVVSVPLRSGEHTMGTMTLYFAERRDFQQSEINLLSAVADGVALALARIDLADQVVHETIAARSFEEADRLKGEFVSTVSHELRTPLTIIKGYSDLLATEQTGPLSETQQKFIAGIQRNTTRLTELVNDLLDIARLESGPPEMAREKVDLCQIVGDACAEYERAGAAAERCVAVRFGDGEESAALFVEGDAARLRQVVNNLLSNAVKYSPAGETVTAECAVVGREVVVSVRDHGPGIPPAAQVQLFQKFYRVDSSLTRLVGGTGLGLAIAKAIVEQHHGRIWVESEHGVGSTFRFALPTWNGEKRGKK